ncbi:MAG: hypothetical protein CM1200mP27_09620 [Chloroflexota bacterium]|nr:MAG: hypothetical protein CM1200mP27_09620 [Chloroflexota bacterium]
MANAGVDGFNLIYSVTPGTFVDFIEGVVPILQKRGLMQKEYAPGPLREKLFGNGRLPDRHPGAGWRIPEFFLAPSFSFTTCRRILERSRIGFAFKESNFPD